MIALIQKKWWELFATVRPEPFDILLLLLGAPGGMSETKMRQRLASVYCRSISRRWLSGELSRLQMRRLITPATCSGEQFWFARRDNIRCLYGLETQPRQ